MSKNSIYIYDRKREKLRKINFASLDKVGLLWYYIQVILGYFALKISIFGLIIRQSASGLSVVNLFGDIFPICPDGLIIAEFPEPICDNAAAVCLFAEFVKLGKQSSCRAVGNTSV